MAAVRLRPLAISARGALRTHAATPKILQATPWHVTRSSPFSTSTLWRAPTQSHTEADSRNKKSYEEEDLDARRTAQRLVDDRPWHREDSHSQPEATSSDPTGHDHTKGRLLTTPTRLLKLILPMPFHPEQHHLNQTETNETSRGSEAEVVEPLAILVHPQQPLSYLERLIQAEIPPLLVKNREKLPDISFRAEADREESRKKQNNNGVDNVATYSGLGREGPDKDRSSVDWVRWSGSTEVGDFIRDAARGREFAINIEGYGRELRVAVPSFKDRTHYMRMRLRRMSREIDRMSKLKNECDQLAHKGAHRIAQGGFAALAGWWGVVYYVTFHTEMGWDLVEPVTYLAGLTTIMGGYLWFLYMSRDLSYKAAMNVTVSRRQNALYQDRGFDITTWEHLVHEANGLRREIKYVAGEYDVDWNETKDLGGQEVKDVLESEESKDDDNSEKKNNNKHKEQSSKSNEKPPPEDKRGEQRASG